MLKSLQKLPTDTKREEEGPPKAQDVAAAREKPEAIKEPSDAPGRDLKAAQRSLEALQKELGDQIIPDVEQLRGTSAELAQRMRSQIDPGALADDADPLLKQLGRDREICRRWSYHFMLTRVEGYGNAGYIIVRETPVRYTIQKASSNPKVLIESQLRLARSGLQTVSEVAGALYPPASVITSSLKAGDAGGSASTSEKAGIQVRVQQEAEAARAHLHSLRTSMVDTLKSAEPKVDDLMKKCDEAINKIKADPNNTKQEEIELKTQTGELNKIKADPNNPKQEDIKAKIKTIKDKIKKIQDAEVEKKQNAIKKAYAGEAQRLYQTELAPVFKAYGEQIQIYGQRLGPEGLKQPDAPKPTGSAQPTDAANQKEPVKNT
jgi:hypothetical protein